MIPIEYFHYIVRRYGGYAYHADGMFRMFNRFSVEGKRVLEIGGSNHPRELTHNRLGARQWICLDTVWHEDDLKRRMPLHYGVEKTIDIGSASTAIRDLPPYLICKGRVEDIPAAWHDQFDSVVSIAAFEHINDVCLAIENIYNVLNKKDGACHISWGAIWSGFNGHHIHPVTLSNGTLYKWTMQPDPWSHLLLNQSEFAAALVGKGANEEAATIVSEAIYESDIINRVFFDDYVQAFTAAPFKRVHLDKDWHAPPDPSQQQLLMGMYPGKKEFATAAAFVSLRLD